MSYAQYIINAANQYGIDPNIALAIAARETGGDDINAINMAPNGGLMQITDYSANDYGVNDMYPDWQTDPQQNALAGMYILSQKIKEQGGDTWSGVRAYNGAGDAAQQYLQQVQTNYNNLSKSTPFVYHGDDAQGNPFMNIQAYIRENNPNERLNVAGLLGMASQRPTTKTIHDILQSPDYQRQLDYLPRATRDLLKPFAQQLQERRAALDKAELDNNSFVNKVGIGTRAINMVNHSNNIDNRNTYASFAKQLGVNVNPGVDQFVSGAGLLNSRIKQEQADKAYADAIDNMEWQKELADKENALTQRKIDMINTLYGGVNG